MAFDLGDFDRPLFLVGCGNMAGAMLARWLESGLDPAKVTIIDPGKSSAPAGVALSAAPPDIFPDGAIIMLGVKPQLLPDVAKSLRHRLKSDALIISMLAGVPIAGLKESLGDDPEYIRMMPNLPVALGQGICAVYADAGTSGQSRDIAQNLLSPLGLVEWIDNQDEFNLITALTGCGPAYVFRFIDAMAHAATELGLEQGRSLRFATAMVQGASSFAAHADEAPAVLADRVASKGGMTREGLDVLDADGRLVKLVTETLLAARDRGAELDKLSR